MCEIIYLPQTYHLIIHFELKQPPKNEEDAASLEQCIFYINAQYLLQVQAEKETKSET